MGYQPPSPMWSPPFRTAAAVIYDLACIWLQAPISDFQMAAGSRSAHGRVVSKQRVQQSWIRINKKTLSDDVCHHALNLVEAELLYKNESTGQSGLHSYLTDPSYPLFLPFAAYLGGLSLWAYAFNLERQSPYQLQQQRSPMEQNTYHVDSYGMAEYPRLNHSILSPGQQFLHRDYPYITRESILDICQRGWYLTIYCEWVFFEITYWYRCWWRCVSFSSRRYHYGSIGVV